MRRLLVFLLVLGVIAGIAVAVWRGVGPLPDPESCHADVQGHRVDLATDQGETATLIAAIGVRRGLPARAVSIALATGFQESKLRNLRSGDRDSLGIFQQRPSQGWGTRQQVLDPYYAINAFYDALQKVPGYEHMRITEAAQKVQRSGYPEAYDVHAADARALASALTGYSGGGQFSCVVHSNHASGSAGKVSTALTRAYGALDLAHGPRHHLRIAVPADAGGRRLGWSVAAFLVGHARSLHLHRVAFHGKAWKYGRASEKGWTHSHAPRDRVTATLG